MKVGDKFKIGRTEYEVVARFVDNGNQYYVAKYKMACGIVSYSNTFTADSKGKLYKVT